MTVKSAQSWFSPRPAAAHRPPLDTVRTYSLDHARTGGRAAPPRDFTAADKALIR